MTDIHDLRGNPASTSSCCGANVTSQGLCADCGEHCEDTNDIVTEYKRPPIPSKAFDYCAYRKGNEEGPTGWGRTEQEAIADLLLVEEGEQDDPDELRADYEYDLAKDRKAEETAESAHQPK